MQRMIASLFVGLLIGASSFGCGVGVNGKFHEEIVTDEMVLCH